MKDLFTLLTGLVGGAIAVVLVAVVYIGIVATFGFALGLGWQAALQLWSTT
jgi:type IV secretory pathway VirB2 component (pilin)